MDRIGLVTALCCAALLTAACSSTDPEPPTPATLTQLGPVHVRYLVTGTARTVSITMQTPSGTSQASGQPLPLTARDGQDGIRFEMGRGEFVYMSAQNEGEYGSVTCTIEVDGEVIAENTATGGFTIASCDGST